MESSALHRLGERLDGVAALLRPWLGQALEQTAGLRSRVQPYLRLSYLSHLAVLLAVVLAVLPNRPLFGESGGLRSLPVFPPSPEARPDMLVTQTLPELLGADAAGIGTAALAASSAVQMPDRAQPAAGSDKPGVPVKYRVVSGDTVSEIAERFGVASEAVLWSNGLSNPEGLQIGDELLIPPVPGLIHTVSSGDNLHNLAQAYGVTPESIAEYNQVADPNALQVGDQLVVPGGKIGVGRVSGSSRGGRPTPLAASGSFRWPAGGSITQYFGENGHSGVDLAAGTGSPIYAADAGVVVTALKLGYGYGWHLVIDHGNGYKTLYSHMSAFFVDYGERVGKGDRIGAVGSTGLSTGPHLHFEIFQNGVRVNPLKFLP
ncbi:MAG: peptidoglycan DD-metalloendopeptidase family protein [Chloroflexota bacterium]